MSLTGLVFMAVFALGCLLALGKHPIFGALTYVAMVFLDPQSRWWGDSLPDVRWSLVSAAVTLIGIAVLKPAPQPLPLRTHAGFYLMVLLLVYACIQWPAVLDVEEHKNFVNYYFKYAIAIYLLYRSVDSEQHFKWLLWAYILGCSYLAWVAFSSYSGGRFDSFGGSGIGDANAGALTLVSGVFICASLFLYGDKKWRLALIFLVPFLINSLVMTVSRSGFLALAVGGLAFNWFTPGKFKARVVALSALGVVGFVLLTNPFYWERMQTVKYQGQDVQGVDTGGARRNLFFAQIKMFERNPLGCGHLCTEFLSPSYLPEKDLNVQTGRRSSHNTFMSMLVDHGIMGAAVYLLTLLWMYVSIRKLHKQADRLPPLLLMLLPGVSASLAALTISDQFVPNVKYELRFWLMTFLMIMVSFAHRTTATATAQSPVVGAGRGQQPARGA